MAQQGERVKVYRLNDEGKWDDKGTGHVSVEYLERSEAVGLVVIDEEDNATTLLIHRISSDDVYRRQEDTIISWRDPEVATDLALSFQESVGCSYIWDQIVGVQRTIQFPSVGGVEGGSRPVYSDFEHSGTSQDDDDVFDVGGGVDILELPPPEIANLPQIVKVVAEVRPFERDRVSSLIVHERMYIQKIAELFRLCEDLDNTEGLHMLYKIIKGLILLNDGHIFDVIFSDEYIMDIVGALEYDPELPSRQEHRSFLKGVVVYKEAVPIHDSTTLSKIHQTYRIGYIKDVILPRVLDDQTFGTLNSMILFNNVAVVSALQGNNEFLGELFQKLRSADTPVHIKKELILFVQEFVNLSKHLQPPNRTRLFGSLVQKGLFDIVTDALQSLDEAVRLSGSDILIVVLCHEPILLRVFLVEQPDHHLFSLLVKGMLTHGEGGLQAQLLEVMRMLLDSDTMDSQQSEKSIFLDVFYDKYMDQLVGALTVGFSSQGASDNHKKVSTSFSMAGKLGPISPETLSNICELLCFCAQHHEFRIKYYIMRNNVVEKILRLTHRREKYLVVAAVRFLRTCVGLKDDFYVRHLVKNNLFEPVIQAFLANGKRYNLLNSAVLELIDFIKKENIKTLVTHIVDTFGEKLEKIDYVDTFQALRLRYEQNLEGAQVIAREGQAGATSDLVRSHITNSHSTLEARNRKDERALDKDEEDYFNEDSDEEEDTMSVKCAAPSFPSPAVVVNGSALAAVLFRGGSFGLVDYEDEEDEAPLAPSSNKKLHPTKRLENRVSVPALSESQWPQEEDRSPKRRVMQEEVGVMKKQRPGHAAQSGESQAVARNDANLMEAGSGREPENTESWRKHQGAVDGSGSDATGVSTSQTSGELGSEGNLETASVVDRCEMTNGGDSSPQSKTGCGKVVDGTNIAHSAGVPNEGDFLREGVQTAQTSPG